ncbi:Toll-Interleukin-Resistance (TIR) domain family protein [Thalictrum thalictroides]|uniref:Toll-Interleukin-Resistance (TIR) domain family protein n=1 Tax=Thalictrum thalictroides TaxID=46969 RepID=A0A7J6V1B1_THATH|nr:Toll-Interleukin-Resistance (TIR) domain family protein [Thalictrum thalictroides]
MSTYLLKNISSNVFRHGSRTISPMVSRPYDVFINHRGIDTKRTMAGLLYDSLLRLNIQAFLDRESMKPGDKLFDKIHAGIRDCKVGVVVLSPNYCNSYFCLHELALMMELKKKVIPIFWDIKPSDLHVLDNGRCSKSEMQRFIWALEEARQTVGITFDSQTGNWPDLVRRTTDIVVTSLIEVEYEQEQERGVQNQNAPVIC